MNNCLFKTKNAHFSVGTYAVRSEPGQGWFYTEEEVVHFLVYSLIICQAKPATQFSAKKEICEACDLRGLPYSLKR